MKRLLLVVFLAILIDMISVPVWAEPFLVCNPDPSYEGFVVSLNGGSEVSTTYQTRTMSDGKVWAIIADCATLPEGPFTYSVKAFNVWGQSIAVPFSSIKALPGAPSGVAIKR